jgi:TM2 domain-containing membrane protein YozV
MHSEFYQREKPGKMMRFFWKAAGADRFILERSTYGDKIKYLCLGGIIIATGLMAALAGGYAFYTIFEPRGNALNSFQTTKNIIGTYDEVNIPTLIKATIFGIFWGLIIFNIDRFIVTSTGKGDGTENITRKELIGAFPRIIMGAVIALTISKPVEIRMFKTEIDVMLHEKQMDQQQAYKAKTDALYASELTSKDLQLEQIRSQISDKIKRHAELEVQWTAEVRIVKPGPKAFALKKQMDYLEADIKSMETSPDFLRIKKEKEAISKRRENDLNQSEKVASGLDGLLERIKIAHEISGFWISTFITLLFMVIELTPIFFKLMLIKSPYDYMEENIKELIKAENGIEVKANYYQDRVGIEKDLVINHQVIRMLKEKIQLLETQSELSQKAIDAWKVQKSENIAQNPGQYIKEEQNVL